MIQEAKKKFKCWLYKKEHSITLVLSCITAALINQVRKRADSSETNLLSRSATSTQAQMVKYLMHERKVELCLGSHHYDDLVRLHLAGLIDIKTDIDFGKTAANTNGIKRIY